MNSNIFKTWVRKKASPEKLETIKTANEEKV